MRNENARTVFSQVVPLVACKPLSIFFFCLLLMALAQPAFAQSTVPAAPASGPWYVDGTAGADDPACGTASAPCASMQAAIDLAASGDTILVAAGAYTYGGESTCTQSTGAPSVVCVLSKQVTLRGGYPSGNWDVNDPVQYVTTIDGENKNRGIFLLTFSSSAASGLSMEGFTVRNSYGGAIAKRPGQDGFFAYGGGLFAENASSLQLKDMTFIDNQAVGSNRSAGYGGAGSGGAVSLRNIASATLENVLFENNQAIGGTGATRGGVAHGGAIVAFKSNLTATNVIFRTNLAQAGSSAGDGEDGGRADALGGAISFQEQSSGTLSQVTATGNRAIGGDATVHAGGGFGGAFEGEQATVTITDGSIRDNLAQGGNAQNGWFAAGGGVMTINSILVVNRVQVINNVAQGGNGASGQFGAPNGGGLTVTWDKDGTISELTMTNSIVAANRASAGQGAQVTGGGAGGLWIQATDAVIDHSTIANNVITGADGQTGQGIWIMNAGTRRGANVTIRRSIISGHAGPVGSAVEIIKGNTLTFDSGLFYDNTWDTTATNPNLGGPANAGVVTGQDAMLQGDPAYMAAGASAFDYHIKAASRARNQIASNTLPVDFENEARTDGRSDFGADEYVATRSPLRFASFNADLDSISLQWDLDPDAGIQVDHYRLTDSYLPGATAVVPIIDVLDIGLQTQYLLSDLQPYVLHQITVDGMDSSSAVVVSTDPLSIITTDHQIYLPAARRR